MSYGDFDAAAGGDEMSTGLAPSDAAQWIRDNLDRFTNLWPAILDLQHRAAVAAAEAKRRGDLQTHQLGRQVIESLQELAQLHQRTMDRLNDYREFFGLSAVQVPVALLTVMSTLALLILWQFRRFDAERELVEKMEAGTLDRADLEAIREGPPGPVEQFTSLGRLALWGGALVLLFLVLRDRGYIGNPELVFLENPGEAIGRRVHQLRYNHAEDGRNYYHDFGPGVRMEGREDGSVLLYHPRKRLWKDFGG